MKKFLIHRWFLIALAVVLATGFLGARWLLPLANNALVRYAVVATVLFLMALPLEARSMWQTLRRPAAPMLAVLLNSAALPLVTWLVGATLLKGLVSDDLIGGLMVAAATPCTLASAAVWTRRAGGNDALSIVVTVVTNATCFLVTPFWLLQTTGQQTHVGASKMIVDLFQIVVLPMTFAQVLRLIRPVGRWSTDHTRSLGVVSQIGVLMIVLFGSIQSAQRLSEGSSRPRGLEVGLVVVSVVTIHTAVCILGMALARACRMGRGDQIAVGFAGSQKTLMVGLQVAMELRLNIIPMVAYHVGQLLVDTFIADRLRARGDGDRQRGGRMEVEEPAV
jgi:sodium/bile acid cotransporter 7